MKFLLYFLVMGVPALVVIFFDPFANLTDWQLGLLGVLFALALVGIDHLVEHGKGSAK